MKCGWESTECSMLAENLKRAAEYAIELQGAARAKSKGAGASEWEKVTEERLFIALESIAQFYEGVKQ